VIRKAARGWTIAGLIGASLCCAAVAAPAAQAEVTSVFGGELPCAPQPDGTTRCAGPGGNENAVADTVPSWDGTPIDINFALPDPSKFGPPPYPLVMYFHGLGGAKESFTGYMKRFTDRGLAAFSMTERGHHESCGVSAAYEALEAASPGSCADGFIHMMDMRYEVRDAQHFAGVLADEGLTEPKKIGVVGGSYGGGKSLILGSLKNRVMLPGGEFVPWKSPAGKSMQISVAAPVVPWSDLTDALAPNGRTIDYAAKNDYGKPYGVEKVGIISGLAASASNFSGTYGPVDPLFDILGWRDRLLEGEPYDSDPQINTAVHEMTNYHSAYYIDDSVEPAPILISQGLADDAFPVDEAVRYINRVQTRYPDAHLGLLVADIGHPRAPFGAPNATGRPADIGFVDQTTETWFAHYLLGEGPEPAAGVIARTQVCPYGEPSGGPLAATSWARLARGEVRLSSRGSRVIESDGGDSAIAGGMTSITPGCAQLPETIEPGVATYDFPVVGPGGYTLAGSPTVIADLKAPNGGESQIASRLLEVTPDGKQRLLARGLYRPEMSGRQVFQLHANVTRMEPGTKLRLELLPKDGIPGFPISYARPSNDQRDIAVSDVEIRVPVREKPGAAGGQVKRVLPKVLPRGRAFAAQFELFGRAVPVGPPKLSRARIKGLSLTVRLNCPPTVNRCVASSIRIVGAKRRGPVGKRLVASGTVGKVAKRRTLRLLLTAGARKALRGPDVPGRFMARVRLRGPGYGTSRWLPIRR